MICLNVCPGVVVVSWHESIFMFEVSAARAVLETSVSTGRAEEYCRQGPYW